MAEETQSSKTTISLRTVDGDIVEVSPEIVKHMQTVQSFIEDDSSIASSVIPLPNVKTFELSKIVDYLDYHHRFREGKAVDSDGAAVVGGDEEAKEFNSQFVEQLSHEQLKELILAANYLNVKDLLVFLSQSVADLIKDKSVEFVRKFFGIVSDFTPEEEATYREEHEWAFEGIED